jgi:hypothetical protein
MTHVGRDDHGKPRRRHDAAQRHQPGHRLAQDQPRQEQHEERLGRTDEGGVAGGCQIESDRADPIAETKLENPGRSAKECLPRARTRQSLNRCQQAEHGGAEDKLHQQQVRGRQIVERMLHGRNAEAPG